ncbi:MAG: hypothetical protein QG567_1697 [Campylobacterota bacterium]|nr:hypothetical protein [Campylobacterota bacterium]
MFIQIILYIHILSATAWIGGALLLFALGIFMRDKDAQLQVYKHLGPLYGYFETVWLVLLWITGLILFFHFKVWYILANDPTSIISYAMTHKLLYVVLITVFTILHMYIALKTHTKTRSKIQNIISRGSSMLIFLLNLGILWFAIQLREILT